MGPFVAPWLPISGLPVTRNFASLAFFAISFCVASARPLRGRVAGVNGPFGAREWWANAEVLRLVREAEAGKKVIGAVGSAAVVLANGIPDIAGKKLTTAKADSSELVRRQANYTGKTVETDGKLVTTTGFDRAAVREFLKAIYRTARSQN